MPLNRIALDPVSTSALPSPDSAASTAPLVVRTRRSPATARAVTLLLLVVIVREPATPKDPGDVIQPLKTTELTPQYQNVAGTAFKAPASSLCFR